MKPKDYYIGLMSGTSADAVDAVVVDFSDEQARLVGTYSTPIPNQLRQKIHSLATPSHDEINQLGALDHALGTIFAAAINSLLVNCQLKPSDIIAIGSHGQTIRHCPTHPSHPFTLQIGDANIIAQNTRITTVADFRRRDMAAGGQGAPLVPAFHKALFHHYDTDRVVVNIGGMANITWLPSSAQVTGFDTGPGNVLMDAWIFKHLGKSFDANGDWAASGHTNTQLLNQLLEHPFFKQTPPKSTGREVFNLEWLESQLALLGISSVNTEAANIQATLLSLTARSISQSIRPLVVKPAEIIVCGGGAYNIQLMKALSQLNPDCAVTSTQTLGIAPEWIEAMAFAWLAKQTLSRKSGNLCAVTGATKDVILGGVYFA
jgi:anhydro-N-acetylmuramic acid kinase